jgi:hypothetical protein
MGQHGAQVQTKVFEHSCPLFFRCFFVQWDFCLGMIPVHVLCQSQQITNKEGRVKEGSKEGEYG